MLLRLKNQESGYTTEKIACGVSLLFMTWDQIINCLIIYFFFDTVPALFNTYEEISCIMIFPIHRKLLKPALKR